MSEINFRPCNKRTMVCAYLLSYHPSVHLQETYNLSSCQRMIRKWHSSWNGDCKCQKVTDKTWHSSNLRKYSRTNAYKEYKSNTLHHARSACWTCIPLFKNTSWGWHSGAETGRRFIVVMEFTDGLNWMYFIKGTCWLIYWLQEYALYEQHEMTNAVYTVHPQGSKIPRRLG
jgi:hypothetical protein